MKQRALLLIIGLTAATPLPIFAAMYAGTVLPLIPACITGGAICFSFFFVFFRAFWILIQS